MFYELSLASNHKDGLCVIKNGQSQVYNEADETLKTLRKQLLETTKIELGNPKGRASRVNWQGLPANWRGIVATPVAV